MAEFDIIMVFGAFVFALLFTFLSAVMLIILFSAFSKKRPKTGDFEPAISIVVPCYNEERNIKDCIDSIYSSDYPKGKMEIIVVDDGSTDRTLSVLDGLREKHADMIIIKGRHGGKSESLNLGALRASNDFIITLDADTVLERNAIRRIVQPLKDPQIGASNGSCTVRNKKSLLCMFQNVEYNYNNLIRKGFSDLFRNSIWFFGFFACYRKDVLKKVGYFKKHSLTEDMDIALEIFSSGYRIINVHDAVGSTLAPRTLRSFADQRTRWWAGALQSLNNNRELLSLKSNPSIIFLFLNQYWWSIYAAISFPLIAYQYNYWLSSNIGSFFDLFMYTFRWFTLLGPFYVIYKIPEWGISVYGIFGVLSGIISALLMTAALRIFGEGLSIRNLVVIFLYFPYTILLNFIVVISLVKLAFSKKRYFIY